MVNYPSLELFASDLGSIGRNPGSLENPYNSWPEQARDVGFAQIEREQFSLWNGHIAGENPMGKFFRNLPSKSPDWSTAGQSEFDIVW